MKINIETLRERTAKAIAIEDQRYQAHLHKYKELYIRQLWNASDKGVYSTTLTMPEEWRRRTYDDVLVWLRDQNLSITPDFVGHCLIIVSWAK